MRVAASKSHSLVDIQGSADQRGITIDEAGISGLRLPAHVRDVDGTTRPTVVRITASVFVRAAQRGAHMSRLVQVFEAQEGRLDMHDLHEIYRAIRRECQAAQARVTVEFPWFVEKLAPVSGIRSSLDVAAKYTMRESRDRQLIVTQELCVPVTTLCPCSKAISKYGAHNQRTNVSIRVQVVQAHPVNELVQAVEACASCEIYGLLKRADEKYVTERAYENPQFVEDVARDVYATLRSRSGVDRVRVEVESQESIHNHQAFALIDDWRQPATLDQ